MTANESPFVAIDSCSMVLLSLYVDSCMALNESLGIDMNMIKKGFKKKKNITKNHLNIEEIRKGWKFYNYLQEKLECSDYNAKFLFSILSEIELLNVFLERVFHRELTNKGVPYRIRTKKPFKLQVDFDYEKEVIEYWNRIREELGKNSIEFNYPKTDTDNTQDVLEITRIISKYVALGPVDLYLYSLGVIERCDEIYTNDEEFRTIINYIHDKQESWQIINESIQEDLINLGNRFLNFGHFVEEFKKEGEIKLPKGVAT